MERNRDTLKHLTTIEVGFFDNEGNFHDFIEDTQKVLEKESNALQKAASRRTN